MTDRGDNPEDQNVALSVRLCHSEQQKRAAETRSVEHDPPCLIFTNEPQITKVHICLR